MGNAIPRSCACWTHSNPPVFWIRCFFLAGDADQVARRYAKTSVLLPTVSDEPCKDYASKKDYFVGFLKGKPEGTIIESYPQVGDGCRWCRDSGIYEFTMRESGDKIRERYSFTYIFEDNEWKISHHHSSVMPELFV